MIGDRVSAGNPTTAQEPSDRVFALSPFQLNGSTWDGGEGRRVLLLHGLGGNTVTWRGVAPVLASSLGARVVAVDLPGFGLTRPHDEPVDIEQQLLLLERLLERVDVTAKWTIAGNSLGGLLGLRLAERFPDRIEALVLAAPALPVSWGRSVRDYGVIAGFLPSMTPGVGRRLVARYVERTGVPGVVDDPVRALFGDAACLDPELRKLLIAVSTNRLGWAREAARAYEQIALSLAGELSWSGAAKRAIRAARCPVQVVYGTADPLFPPATWEALRRTRPDWTYVELPGVGHVPQLEAPAQVAASIIDWLS